MVTQIVLQAFISIMYYQHYVPHDKLASHFFQVYLLSLSVLFDQTSSKSIFRGIPTRVYSKTCQTSKIELLGKIVNDWQKAPSSMFDRVLSMPLFKKSTEKPIGSIHYVSRDYSKPLLGATITCNPVHIQNIALKNVLIRTVEHDICLGVQAKKPLL